MNTTHSCETDTFHAKELHCYHPLGTTLITCYFNLTQRMMSNYNNETPEIWKIGGALPVKIQNLITNFIPIIWICRMELPTSGITLRSLQNETSLYRKQRRAGFLFKLKHFELESLCEPTRNGLESAKGQTELKLKKLLFCSQQILQKSFSTVKYFPICHV